MPRRGPNDAPVDRPLLLAVDLAGTLVFAVEGAVRAVDVRFDLFGVLVLAFATAIGGGTIRDVLIGDLPPTAYRYARYAITAIVGGVVVFVLHSPI
jgi:uncharacterized membrane protein YeiH